MDERNYGTSFFYWFIYLCWHLNYLLILELLFFSMVKGVSHLTTLTTLNNIRWYVVKATCLWYKPVCAHAVKAPSEHFMLLCSQTVTWGTAVLWWIFIFNLFINVVKVNLWTGWSYKLSQYDSRGLECPLLVFKSCCISKQLRNWSPMSLQIWTVELTCGWKDSWPG